MPRTASSRNTYRGTRESVAPSRGLGSRTPNLRRRRLSFEPDLLILPPERVSPIPNSSVRPSITEAYPTGLKALAEHQCWGKTEPSANDRRGAGLYRAALGPVVLRAADRATVRPDPAAWRALALAVTVAATDLIIADRRAASMVAALWQRGAPASLQCDELVTGRIGDHFSSGCFTFVEVCSIAAGDLVRTGRAGQAEAALRSGISVRALLRELYGVTAAPEWDARQRSAGPSSGRCARRVSQRELIFPPAAVGSLTPKGVRFWIPADLFFMARSARYFSRLSAEYGGTALWENSFPLISSDCRPYTTFGSSPR